MLLRECALNAELPYFLFAIRGVVRHRAAEPIIHEETSWLPTPAR